MEGYTYYFTYEETRPHKRHEFYDMPCSGGGDLSQGGDFCAFTFLFPLSDESFGVKCRSYISDLTYQKLPLAMRQKYDEFISEGSLIVLPGTIINTEDVYDDLMKWLDDNHYDCRTFGYDPYNAKDFIERWCSENGSFGVEKVIQGAKTETVPLTELKALASERMLIFDEKIMQFTMGNAITIEDTNGNKKLLKKRYEAKIDNVSAMMDAFVAYKLNRDAFE
jgi:phage terminase large subunit-like protein